MVTPLPGARAVTAATPRPARHLQGAAVDSFMACVASTTGALAARAAAVAALSCLVLALPARAADAAAPAAGTAAAPGCAPPAAFVAEGDAYRDAAGSGQLFEQVAVPGISDYREGTSGFAIVDVNGDRRPDLFTLATSRIRLLVNDGCFRFTETPVTLHGLAGNVASKNVPTFADFDRDGFLDFYVPASGSTQAAQFFLSDGRWNAWTDVAATMGVQNRGAYARGTVSVGDVNGDGWLDFAVGANQIGTKLAAGRPLSRLYVYEPATSGRYRDGRFRDIGGSDLVPGYGGVDAGRCDPDTDRAGFVVALRDLDDDGDLDFVHLAHNDMLESRADGRCPTGENAYGVFAWRNRLADTRSFRLEPVPPGPGSLAEHGRMRFDPSLGHYVAVRHAVGHEVLATADTDNDGDLDVLTTGPTDHAWHVHSDQVAGRFRINDGDFTFRDATDAAGLSALNWTLRQWGEFWDVAIPDTLASYTGACERGAQRPLCAGVSARDYQLYTGGNLFADVDNDGWVDMLLYVRQGNPAAPGSYRSVLFMNNGDGTFRPTTTQFSGITELALGAQAADLDGDGLLDLYFMGRGRGQLQPGDKVFRNTGAHGGAANHWLRVRLTGRPFDALVGARVFAFSPRERRLLSRHDALVDVPRGSRDLTAHFGLGRHTDVAVLVVLADGSARVSDALPVDGEVDVDVTAGRDLGRAGPERRPQVILRELLAAPSPVAAVSTPRS
jgi:hypothetical protein